VAFNPGTALNAAHVDRFFMCDFPGSVRSFAVKPAGAGFGVVDDRQFLGELWPTDCKFGPDGALYVSDWVQGWGKPEKGRIFRVHDPSAVSDTAAQLAAPMSGREIKDLHALLSHADLRVRQAAQFELVASKKADVLTAVAQSGTGLSRLHGIWGLGQLGAAGPLRELLKDRDAEVRAQSAKVLGDLRDGVALLPLLDDPSPRVRFFAALSLGKCRLIDAREPLIRMLRDNEDQDAFLRHAGVAALVWIGDFDGMLRLAKDSSKAVRLAAVLGLRRLGRVEVKYFLRDDEPSIVLEAARAIHDAPIDAAQHDLAELLKTRDLPVRVAVRAVNAAFRAGRIDLLLPYMADVDGPEELRIQALDSLADWIWPNGRDRVVGLWRPVPPRPLPDDLEAVLRRLIRDTQPEGVRVHALRAWGELELPSAPEIEETLAATSSPSTVRVEALRTMSKSKDPGTKAAITSALEDPDPGLREEGVKLLVRLRLPDTTPLLEKLATAKGALAVRQAAVASLGDCADADAGLARLLDQGKDLPAGLFLELLEAAGKRPGLKDRRDRLLQALPPNAELLEGGDVKAGREIFFERLDVACARCHTIKDKGGVVGPPLTKVGVERTREQILESILFPNKVIVQGYGQVMLRMAGDAIEVGRVEKETESELVLLLGDGTRRTLSKVDIRARKEGLSAMPDDVSKPLSRRELRDLVAFLASPQ
ncbi:MAG TPA: HEAT repeat domain-containing protein, partial [Planctomycetota bacterium]|nr:HEAT repeat domain-containing protein [Planctomycetota bacterium]